MQTRRINEVWNGNPLDWCTTTHDRPLRESSTVSLATLRKRSWELAYKGIVSSGTLFLPFCTGT
eukprot:6777251-Pyramimonas_sp.AAC.1